ncbi:ABC transporter ATP-binding protein/permease [Actinosynnema sp. NPDC059797]
MMLHRALLALAGDIRGHLGVNIALGLLITLANVGQGLLTALVFARLLTGADLAGVRWPLVALAAVVLLRAGLVIASEIAAQRTAHAVKLRVRARLFTKLLALGPGYLTDRRSGDVQSTLVDGVESLETYYSRYLPTVAVCLLGPAGILVYLAARDPLSAVVIALCVLVVLVLPRLWDRTLGKAGAEHWGAFGRLNADYIDAMQGMTTLKSFNAVERERNTLGARAHQLYKASMRHLGLSLFDSGITTFGLLAGPALAIALGVLRFASGSLDLFTLLVLLLLSRECFRPLGDLSKYWHAGYLGVAAAKKIDELLTAPPLIGDRPDGPAVDARSLRPVVAFEGVSFTYPGRDVPAVRDIDFTVEPGHTVAVVGESGSGKSTLVGLLMRYFDPSHGRITIDGHDIRALPVEDLRSLIAVVSQDTYLFTGTVADNIRLGKPEATDEEVRAAALAANAAEFIEALPDGYGTELGERALTLSGGQRQRIAIARALLKDAPILVLDEATSSVDSVSEAAIQQALGRASRGRTTLVVAHRLSTVRDAEQIILLGDSRIREVGVHDDLMRRRGDYARLVAAQSADN